MRNRFSAAALILAAALLVAGAASAQVLFTVSGNIDSGAEYDLYTVDIPHQGTFAVTLVCDFDGVSRPLDPVVSVYFPGGGDPSDTINADAYNDDGFGLDDDPQGVDCDAFDSSRAFFFASDPGTYTFRADGFGSSTGPYTMTVFFSPQTTLEIPTLDGIGVATFSFVLLLAAVVLLRARRRTTH